MKVHENQIDGLQVQTGDILCMTSGEVAISPGQFWRLLGKLVPGAVDHVAVYIGPEGRCVEVGAGGVNDFDLDEHEWNSWQMVKARWGLIDQFYGVAYPLMGKKFSAEEETMIRLDVAAYCLDQAETRKPYNINFLNPNTEDSFYCSQLPYLAYLRHGIDLNSGLGVPNLPRTEGIVFPQEIWSGCYHHRVNEAGVSPPSES